MEQRRGRLLSDNGTNECFFPHPYMRTSSWLLRKSSLNYFNIYKSLKIGKSLLIVSSYVAQINIIKLCVCVCVGVCLCLGVFLCVGVFMCVFLIFIF